MHTHKYTHIHRENDIINTVYIVYIVYIVRSIFCLNLDQLLLICYSFTYVYVDLYYYLYF